MAVGGQVCSVSEDLPRFQDLTVQERTVFDYNDATAADKTTASQTSRGTYKEYSNDSMKSAVEAVRGGMTIRRAAETFNVPKSTLGDRCSGKVNEYCKPGPPPYLNCHEEEELASFLIKCAEIGFPRNRAQVLGLVQQIVESKGLNKSVSNGWWERFIHRQPHVTLRVPMSLARSRAIASDPNIIDRYYTMLEETLRDNGLMNSPSCIFNCDETGLPLNPSSFKIVTKKGSKNVSCISSNSKSQITVLACTSAAGYTIPPFIIFSRSTYHPHLSKGEIPGTMYGMTPKGWMTRKLFFQWFQKHFLRYIPSARPILLILDGHSSHYCPEFIKLAAKERIIIFVLPPHTSHLSQPLDRGCFSPLKTYWKHVCHKFYTDNAHTCKNISSYDFVGLFNEAWSSAMTMKNVIVSFKVTGIYPFNRNAIHVPGENYKEFRPEKLCKQTGLAYIPLYSPCSHSVVRRPVINDSIDVQESSDEENENYVVSVQPSSSSISKFLNVPTPLSMTPVKQIKPAGGVITTADYIKQMEDKLEIKRKNDEEKRRKREERQKKREIKNQEFTNKTRDILDASLCLDRELISDSSSEGSMNLKSSRSQSLREGRKLNDKSDESTVPQSIRGRKKLNDKSDESTVPQSIRGRKKLNDKSDVPQSIRGRKKLNDKSDESFAGSLSRRGRKLDITYDIPDDLSKMKVMPFNKKMQVEREKIILSWFVDEKVVMSALHGMFIDEDEVEVIPEKVSASCIDESVCLDSCHKYFTQDGWMAVKSVVECVKRNPVWVCASCSLYILDENESSICCDSCLSWHHFHCVGLYNAPVTDFWFCISCMY